MSEINDIISGLALAQLRYWILKRRSLRLHMQDFLNARQQRPHAIFLYEFSDGEVRILEDSGNVLGREQAYLALFKLVLQIYRLRLEGIIAVWVADLSSADGSFPFFAFQKGRGTNTILLPDIDFLVNDFYSSSQWRMITNDTLPYSAKINSAAFVGSTSEDQHTQDSVAAISSRRLRSGLFFRHFPNDVTFLLPNIVQCESDDVEQMIRSLGFGTGSSGWADQFLHKFLLSMDGNGATCSRVAIALKSNSVLVKYEQVPFNDLYYFPAMIPYLHYIPVETDNEVIEIIQTERKKPGIFATVARNGTKFYNDFLNISSVIRYTAELLGQYFSLYGVDGSATVGSPDGFQAFQLPQVVHIFATVHIAGRGDVGRHIHDVAGGCWLGEPGTGLAVEGFELTCFAGLLSNEIEYCASSELEGSQTWRAGGEFAGSRGLSQPLLNFAFRLLDEAGNSHTCKYHGVFANGEVSDVFSDGENCASRFGTPVEAINLEIIKAVWS